MTDRKHKYSIPHPSVVRAFAVVLLLVDIASITILAYNYSTLNWVGWVLMFGVFTSMYFPIMALKTGDPEWVLLDLILPG